MTTAWRTDRRPEQRANQHAIYSEPSEVDCDQRVVEKQRRERGEADLIPAREPAAEGERNERDPG